MKKITPIVRALLFVSVLGISLISPLAKELARAAQLYGPGYGPAATSAQGVELNTAFHASFGGAYLIDIGGTDFNAFCFEYTNSNHPEHLGQVLQSPNQYSTPEFDYLLYRYGNTADNDRAVALEMLGWYYTAQENNFGVLLWSDVGNGFAPIDPNSPAFSLYYNTPSSTHLATAEGYVTSMFNEAAQMVGPWTVQTSIDPGWAGGAATASIAVRSSTNAAVANQTLTLNYTNATGPATVTTDGFGNASVTLNPTDILQSFSVTASTTSPGTHREYVADNAGPTQRVSVRGIDVSIQDSDSQNGLSSNPLVTTNASSPQVLLGGGITDSVTLSGVDTGVAGTISVSAYGPYANLSDITAGACQLADLAWTSSDIATNGSGTHSTNSFTPPQAGYYTFLATWTGPGGPATHPCGDLTENFIAYQPSITTRLNDSYMAVNTNISDIATLANVPSNVSGTITFELYGPFAAQTDINSGVCTAQNLVLSQDYSATGSGDHTSPTFNVAAPGYYTFVALWDGNDGSSATHACGQNVETFYAFRALVATNASKDSIDSGEAISDDVELTGVPDGITGVAEVALYGPMDLEDPICDATNLITKKTITTDGSDTYTSDDFQISNMQPGSYSFVASWQADDYLSTATHECGVPTESFEVKAAISEQQNNGITSEQSVGAPDTGLGLLLANPLTLTAGVGLSGGVLALGYTRRFRRG